MHLLCDLSSFAIILARRRERERAGCFALFIKCRMSCYCYDLWLFLEVACVIVVFLITPTFCQKCVFGDICKMGCHVFSICVYVVVFQDVPISITALCLLIVSSAISQV